VPGRQALRLPLGRDGVHFDIRLEEDRQCILVLMGAPAEGKKELIALAAGPRESEQSWRALLLDCQSRGLVLDPKVAVGDGGLGFWKACWFWFFFSRFGKFAIFDFFQVSRLDQFLVNVFLALS
jgi:hypothetical protein